MTKKTTRIAFTSCARLEAFPKQPEWARIHEAEPDYLFLLGDQIYMDYGFRPFSREWNGKPSKYSPELFGRIMRAKYQAQWSEPHFERLFSEMKARNAVFGVWDDHDFAWNNAVGSKVCEKKTAISRALFREFMGMDGEDGEIYQAIDLPHGRAIFLDVRSHAQPAGAGARLLGEEQFQFLERSLRHSGRYTLIASGLTLTHGQERWDKYPEEYERLSCLLEEAGGKVLFLAGDIHKNKFAPPSGKRPCYEIVSSGLAVNYFGLGRFVPFDDRHNWGLLELADDTATVSLFSKRKKQVYEISALDWSHRRLG